MPDMLAVDERGGASVAITRYQSLFNPTAMSAGFGTALAGGDDGHNSNDRIFVLTDDTIYFVNWEGLWRSTDSGATFTLNKTFALGGQAASTDPRLGLSGIFMAYDNGANELYLCGVRIANTNEVIGWRLNLDTDTFEETNPGLGTISAPFILSDAYLFNNVLHFTIGNGTGGAGGQRMRSWDPISQSMAEYTPPWNVTGSLGYGVLDDGNLYAITARSAFNDSRLLRFTGTWSEILNVSAHGAAVNSESDESRFAIFTDPTTGDGIIFTLIENGATVGWSVTRTTSAAAFVGFIQTTVLAGHPSLLSNADGGTGTNVGDKRVFVIKDTQTTPGTTRIYLAFSDNSSFGTPFAFYEWQGVGSPILFLGSGGNVHNGISTPQSGGHRFYVPGQLGVRLIDPVRDAVLGGQRLHFVGFGGGTHSVRFRRAKRGQDTDGGLATLIGPVTGGGVLGANQVDGHPFDGTTVGTVVWDLTNDTPAFNAGEANTVLVPEAVA